MQVISSRRTWVQLLRFAVVGLVSNGLLYALYLLLAAHGLSPKMAMSVCYALGVAQTFAANRQWTFQARGARGGQFVRYVSTYAAGYLANLAALHVLVGKLGWPHEWVQGGCILAVAALVFVLQKTWVFKP